MAIQANMWMGRGPRVRAYYLDQVYRWCGERPIWLGRSLYIMAGDRPPIIPDYPSPQEPTSIGASLSFKEEARHTP